ncbi:MAG: FecR family protein [Pseudomonadota bacterium]
MRLFKTMPGAKSSLSKRFAQSTAAGALATSLLAQAAWAAPVIGTSAAVRGNVFVTTQGAERKARVRDAIKLEDRVLTRDDSALQILLLDQTTFTVGQNCEMTIDRFVYDPATSAGTVSARVAKGAFRFMSGRIGKQNPTNASVDTPAATIGIRGTSFEGIVGEDAIALAGLAGLNTAGADPRSASIVILKGPGSRRNSLDNVGAITVSNSGGSQILTAPNYAVFVSAIGAAPSAPFQMTPAMQDYLDFFLRSKPNGAPVNPADVLDSAEGEAGQDKFELPEIGTDPPAEDLEDGLQDPSIQIFS